MTMPVEGAPAAAGGRPAPTAYELFSAFLKLGLMAFGGALPLARRMAVDDRQWLSPDEFTDMLGLCQVLPGGNVINFAVSIGARFRGMRGALAALAGFVAIPTVVVILLANVYDRYQHNVHVAHFFAGLAAAAAGLMVSVAWRIASPLRRKPVSIVVALTFFVAIALLRLPLLPTMAVLIPGSVLAIGRFGA